MTDTRLSPTDATQRPPRFAYLLLTHKDVRHIEELASRILDLSQTGHVVVHHDLASDELPWEGKPPERVHFVDRGRVLWGDWSIVEATLRMIRFAHEELNADWCALLSGEHRPIVDLQQWERSTFASGVDAFVEAEALPEKLTFGRGNEDANRFLARCLHRWVTIDEPSFRAGRKTLGGLWRVSRYGLPLGALEYSHRRQAWFIGSLRHRDRPQAMTFHKGTQWIGFNRRSASVILDTDPTVTEWFKLSHIPDETYLQTVLHNAPGLVVTNQLVTYVPEGPDRPTAVRWMVLSQDDLPTVWQSEAAFARKVDPDERPEVIKAIDEKVERERGGTRGARTEGPAA